MTYHSSPPDDHGYPSLPPRNPAWQHQDEPRKMTGESKTIISVGLLSLILLPFIIAAILAFFMGFWNAVNEPQKPPVSISKTIPPTGPIPTKKERVQTVSADPGQVDDTPGNIAVTAPSR